MNQIEVYLDETPVRFTEDGRVYVIDAIAVVTEAMIECTAMKRAAPLWENLVRQSPELLGYCHEIVDQDRNTVPVADSSGWDKIHEKLFELLLEQLSSQDGVCADEMAEAS